MQRTPRRTGREGRKSERKEGTWLASHAPSAMGHHSRQRTWSTSTRTPRRTGREGRKSQKERKGRDVAGVARTLCHGPPLQAEDVEHQHTHAQKDGEGREEESERKEGKGRGWRRTHPLPWATTPGKGRGAPAHAPPEGRGGKGGRVRKKGREGTWLASHAPSAMGHHSRQRTWSTSTRTPRRTEREGRKRRRGDGREHGHPLCF